jgi:hypothetical protein
MGKSERPKTSPIGSPRVPGSNPVSLTGPRPAARQGSVHLGAGVGSFCAARPAKLE